MKKFTIVYTETLRGEFEVDAENELEAVQEFWHLVGEGKIDLLDSEMMDSNATAYPSDEE